MKKENESNRIETRKKTTINVIIFIIQIDQSGFFRFYNSDGVMVICFTINKQNKKKEEETHFEQ